MSNKNYRRSILDNRKAAKRSPVNKRATCFGDLIHAARLIFPHTNTSYLARNDQFTTNYKLYEDDNGKVELVGFMRYLPKGKFEVSRKFKGLDWVSVFKFSEITCVGTKVSHDW
jgi:hypothetical protein